MPGWTPSTTICWPSARNSSFSFSWGPSGPTRLMVILSKGSSVRNATARFGQRPVRNQEDAELLVLLADEPLDRLGAFGVQDVGVEAGGPTGQDAGAQRAGAGPGPTPDLMVGRVARAAASPSSAVSCRCR